MNNPTTLNYWPLVVVIEDCFIPKLAPVVMETIAEVDIRTVTAMLAVMSYRAEQDAGNRTN